MLTLAALFPIVPPFSSFGELSGLKGNSPTFL